MEHSVAEEGGALIASLRGDVDLEEMARNYRVLIGEGDRDFLRLRKIVLERHGDIEMIEDFYWSRIANLRYAAVDWAERHGLLDELKASKDSLDRPRLGVDDSQ